MGKFASTVSRMRQICAPFNGALFFMVTAALVFIALTGTVDAQQNANQSCDLACPAWTSAGASVCIPKYRCVGVPAYEKVMLPAVPASPQPDLIQPDTPRTSWTIVDEPMSFNIVRADVQVCRPNCPEWISASGTIKPNTPSKLRKILKQMGKRRLPIILDSRGGAVNAAIEMGRIIRKRGLDVAIGKTMYFGCNPSEKGCKPDFADGAYAGYAYPEGSICMSACPFFAAGGVKRLVGFQAQVGIHQITTTVTNQRIMYETRYRIVRGKKKIIDRKILSREATGTYETTELRKGYRKTLNAYFSEMGVDSAIVDRMLAVSASDIYVLRSDDLLKYRFTTQDGDSRVFTPGNICAGDTKPANCVQLAYAAIQKTKDAVPDKLQEVPYPSMNFEIVRSGNSLCEPVCPQWIVASGYITSDSPSQLRKVFDRIDGRRFPIVLDSSGGDVKAAMELGIMIRQRSLDVVIGSTRIDRCLPDPKECQEGAPENRLAIHAGYATSFGACDAACVYMMAGGVKRLMGYSGRIGVHEAGVTVPPMRAEYKKQKASVDQQPRKLEPWFYNTYAEYLKDMGIKPVLLDWGQAVPAQELSILTTEQAADVRLITAQGSVDDLTAIKICRTEPRAANCVERVAGDAISTSSSEAVK